MRVNDHTRFEPWHTIVTLCALNLCAWITVLSVETHRAVVESSNDPLAGGVWIWIFAALGTAGCLYLLKELSVQIIRLVKMLVQKFWPSRQAAQGNHRL